MSATVSLEDVYTELLKYFQRECAKHAGQMGQHEKDLCTALRDLLDTLESAGTLSQTVEIDHSLITEISIRRTKR